MMKRTVLLLVAILIPAKCTCENECAIDTAIGLKIQASVDSKVSAALWKAQMICTNVLASGADVSCPSGFTPTGCACGMTCGSWDIRGDNTCHCQCANIDWTSARCCRVDLGYGSSGAAG